MIIYISQNPNKKAKGTHNMIEIYPEKFSCVCTTKTPTKAFIIILNLLAALVGGFRLCSQKCSPEQEETEC